MRSSKVLRVRGKILRTGEDSHEGSDDSQPSYNQVFERTSGMKRNEFGSVQTFPAGVELLQQEQPVNVIYFVQDGVIKLVWADVDGNETIVGLRWAGWFLGAAARIAQASNPATAVTLVESRLESILFT